MQESRDLVGQANGLLGRLDERARGGAEIHPELMGKVVEDRERRGVGLTGG